MRPRNIDGLIFDLDGTIYLGEHLLPGALEAIPALRAAGKHLLFVSNNPLSPPRLYAEKLTGLGLPTRPDEVITSGCVLGSTLARQSPVLRLYVIGEQSLKSELQAYGLVLVDAPPDADPRQVIDPRGIDALVVSFDRTLDYRKLNIAYQALLNGAHFFATNSDTACPMPGGTIPDAGATIAYLEHISGRKLELLAGKPSPLMLETALERMGLPAGRCMMVGDRLETDMRMGQQAGMATALMLTGATTRAQAQAAENPPDYLLESLAELPKIAGLVRVVE
jgi:arabinose operon protein AraL